MAIKIQKKEINGFLCDLCHIFLIKKVLDVFYQSRKFYRNMKSISQVLLIMVFGLGVGLAHIPQPQNPSHLSKEQMEEISRVVGDYHKKGAPHGELHDAVIKLYKKWNIEYKKIAEKKKKLQN